MLTQDQHKRLSKYFSLVLRHEPQKLGLTLSEEGFVELDTLLTAMRRKDAWAHVTEAMIREVVAQSDKQRFEIAGMRIRARYGHSVEQAVRYEEVEPPEILYHGTSPEALPSIRQQGLLPMQRQYVHLSTVVDQARMVGRRHHHEPVLLRVRAKEAWRAGVKFYQPEPRLYISTAIPAEFLEEGG